MKKIVAALLLLLCPFIYGQSIWAKPAPVTQPHCPIILVHGLGGWGSEKLAGNYYWGGKNERLNDYIARVFNTLGDTKDIGTWDTSIAGAQELNSAVNCSTVDPEAYYFSYENEKTFPVGKQFYLPDLTINPAGEVLSGFSVFFEKP